MLDADVTDSVIGEGCVIKVNSWILVQQPLKMPLMVIIYGDHCIIS